MKRTIFTALMFSLVLGLALAPGAEAGLFDKWRNKDKDQSSDPVPRYDLYPSMSFHKGVLGRGIAAAWTLDDKNLHFLPDCVITNEMGGDSELREGREVLIMGTRFGDTIVVHRVRIVKPDYMNEGLSNSATVTPSEVDPTVGEGTGPL